MDTVLIYAGTELPANDCKVKFTNEKFDKLQQEQRDLEESYQQSKRNKKEREIIKENEEYLKEIQKKL